MKDVKSIVGEGNVGIIRWAMRSRARLGAVQNWNTQAGDRGSNSCYVRFGSGVLIVPNMRQP